MKLLNFNIFVYIFVFNIFEFNINAIIIDVIILYIINDMQISFIIITVPFHI